MSTPRNPVVVIPARMASTRLPNKPLADICGEPMIVQVWRRANEAAIGPVLVACAEQEIADAVEAVGGIAVLTDPDLPSGSDRVHQALQTFDPDGKYDAVVNVQGDLPTIDAADIRAVFEPLNDPAVDIATLAAEITRIEERTNPNVVKAVAAFGKGVLPGRFISRARPRLMVTGRFIIISGFIPIAVRHWTALLPCRRANLKAVKSSNSCVRLKTAW